MGQPDVSVITTVRDGERHLGEAVASALAQEGVALEVVVVSDGSTDGTERLLAELDDPRLVVRCRGHEGRARSLNEAVGLSRGRHVAILDSDDRFLPGHLTRLVARLDHDESLVAVGSAEWSYVDERGEPLGVRQMPVQDDADVRTMLRRGRIPFHHSSMGVRRTALDEVGGYDERAVHADDLDVLVRLSGVGAIGVEPVATMQTRRHAGQWFGGRRGGLGDLRSRVATRRVVQEHVAEVLGGRQPVTARLWAQELGALGYWHLRRLKGERPLLPPSVRGWLDRRQVRPG
jgi:glycosyltransferase involved in cell wall biosynthesis